jgi:hypothetical protein
MATTHPPSELSRLFTTAETLVQKEIPRLAISLEALDKCGKTHWALFTPPDPICLVTNDPGTTHVLKKAIAAGRRIPHVMELSYAAPDPSVTKSTDIDKAEWAVWQKEWARFKSGMAAVVKDKSIRTLVWDQGTDLWNLCMLSHFGKVRAIPQHLRTECNADYSGVFWDLYKGRPDLNMILIHQIGKEYKPNSKGESDWTGKYEHKGFNKTGYQVDMVVRSGWDGVRKSFYTEIAQPTRFGFDMTGQRWYGEESGFGWLALAVFPETAVTPEMWGL